MDISRGIRRCNQVLKIIITGPESSGKTTLCSQLSTYFKYPLVSEYAREYIDQLDRSYNKDDLLEISKEQRNREFTGGKILLCDTDLITIKIWSLFKYNSCDEKIIDQIEMQKSENRFYILYEPSIPWEEDNQRENPNDRERIFELYKKELDSLKYNYIIVNGSENARLEKCTKVIQEITKYI